MKILLDAQLPRMLIPTLVDLGFDAIHTFDLPEGNRASDAMVCAQADQDQRVVFSKDDDFVRSHLLQGTPKQLLLITTGNIRNQEIISLLLPSLPLLADLFEQHGLVELSRTALIIRR